VALYQCHLPKMDDADVIDFDHSRGTVERGPNADQLYVYLSFSPTAPGANDSRSDEAAGVRRRLAEFLS
jgi:hypothetical protein